MLSIIIPARNEAENLEDILNYFVNGLNNIDYELLLINDYSIDRDLTPLVSLYFLATKLLLFKN